MRGKGVIESLYYASHVYLKKHDIQQKNRIREQHGTICYLRPAGNFNRDTSTRGMLLRTPPRVLGLPRAAMRDAVKSWPATQRQLSTTLALDAYLVFILPHQDHQRIFYQKSSSILRPCTHGRHSVVATITGLERPRRAWRRGDGGGVSLLLLTMTEEAAAFVSAPEYRSFQRTQVDSG